MIQRASYDLLRVGLRIAVQLWPLWLFWVNCGGRPSPGRRGRPHQLLVFSVAASLSAGVLIPI
jgi:hypothetical protein